MNVAAVAGAGRARSGPGTTNSSRRAKTLPPKEPKPNPLAFPRCEDCAGRGWPEAAPGDRCPTCHGEGRRVSWSNPLVRVLLQRVVKKPAFAALGLGRPARACLHDLIDRRNSHTGQLNPSREAIGEGVRYKARSISTGTGQLAALGLIRKQQQRRAGGWTTSNDYWFTPAFFELAEQCYGAPTGCNFRAPPGANSAASRLQGLLTNGDPPDLESAPSEPSREDEPREEQSTPPEDRSTDATTTALCTWEQFETLYREIRKSHYGPLPYSPLHREKREEGGKYLQSLRVRASELAVARGLTMDADQVLASIVTDALAEWFKFPGSTPKDDATAEPFLVRKRHPLWALYGDDLIEFCDAAFQRWAASLTKPRRAPAPQPPPPVSPAHQDAGVFLADLAKIDPETAARLTRLGQVFSKAPSPPPETPPLELDGAGHIPFMSSEDAARATLRAAGFEVDAGSSRDLIDEHTVEPPTNEAPAGDADELHVQDVVADDLPDDGDSHDLDLPRPDLDAGEPGLGGGSCGSGHDEREHRGVSVHHPGLLDRAPDGCEDEGVARDQAPGGAALAGGRRVDGGELVGGETDRHRGVGDARAIGLFRAGHAGGESVSRNQGPLAARMADGVSRQRDHAGDSAHVVTRKSATEQEATVDELAEVAEAIAELRARLGHRGAAVDDRGPLRDHEERGVDRARGSPSSEGADT